MASLDAAQNDHFINTNLVFFRLCAVILLQLFSLLVQFEGLLSDGNNEQNVVLHSMGDITT